MTSTSIHDHHNTSNDNDHPKTNLKGRDVNDVTLSQFELVSSKSNPADKNDLPLLANTHSSLVHHFNLKMKCDFKMKKMHGEIILFMDMCHDENLSLRIFTIQDYISNKPKWKFSECDNQDNKTWDREDFERSNLGGPGQAVTGHKFSSPNQLKTCSINLRAVELDKLLFEAKDLNILEVHEIILSDQQKDWVVKNKRHRLMSSLSDGYDEIALISNKTKLYFEVDEWCLRIDRKHDSETECVLSVVYETDPSSLSLRWVTDQDGHPCVYSSGMWLNNRSLMPCHEFGNLSTWSVSFVLDKRAVAVISGDAEPTTKAIENDLVEWKSTCSMPLPSFAFAFAIGYWASVSIPMGSISLANEGNASRQSSLCSHDPSCHIPYCSTEQIPIRLVAPPSMLHRMQSELGAYAPRAFAAIQALLGRFPFPRVDFVLYPACQQDLALSCPGLIFVSESLLPGDLSQCIHISHELSHAWWGLLIGAQDWTEEWLSEGFATFTEDAVHALAQQVTEKESLEMSELRAYLRYRILKNELLETNQSLQQLRPNHGKAVEENCVKNGMNPEKLFTKIHYLKGYFLLRYLSSLTGVSSFFEFLRHYIWMYHGCMVTSQNFLECFSQYFPSLKIIPSELAASWLDESSLPEYMKDFRPSEENTLYKATTSWHKTMQAHFMLKRKKEKSWDFLDDKLSSDQIVLVLELFLEEDKIPRRAIIDLRRLLSIPERNCDVRHRWCELVIKHKIMQHLDDVIFFLEHDQAMGAYLYGELMISEHPKMISAARKIFEKLKVQMEPGTRQAIMSMIYGHE